MDVQEETTEKTTQNETREKKSGRKVTSRYRDVTFTGLESGSGSGPVGVGSVCKQSRGVNSPEAEEEQVETAPKPENSVCKQPRGRRTVGKQSSTMP